MRILSIDHGKRSGWAYILDGELQGKGFFEVAGKGHGSMLASFEDSVKKLIDKYKPEVLCTEIPHDLTNGRTTRLLTGYYSILLKEAFRNYAEELELHPSSVKKMVTGDGRAEKWDVADALSVKMDIPIETLRVPKYYIKNCKFGKKGDIRGYVYDESDAVALAYAGAYIKGDIR